MNYKYFRKYKGSHIIVCDIDIDNDNDIYNIF